MARHETEMHRQWHLMRSALESIDGGDPHPRSCARKALLECFGGDPDIGLFGDYSQMDLADRRDL